MTTYETIFGVGFFIYGLVIFILGQASFGKTGKVRGGRAHIIGLCCMAQYPCAWLTYTLIVSAEIEMHKAHKIWAALPSIVFVGFVFLALTLSVLWGEGR